MSYETEIIVEIVKHQMGKHNQKDHAKGLKQIVGNAKRAADAWVKKHPKATRAAVLGAGVGVAVIGAIADMHATEVRQRLGRESIARLDELQARNEKLAARMKR